MSNPWFRLYAELATDPKIQMMSEAYQRRYIMLLCLRCSNGDVTLQDEEVAFQLRISSDEWAETKRVFVQKNLLDSTGAIVAWDKRQYISDSSRERVARFREKKKQACNVTVTPPESDTDTDISTTDVVDKPPKKRASIPKPDAVAQSVWDDFLEIRKAKKSPLGPTALHGIEREASKAGLSLEAALSMCCSRGWQSFKADWVKNQPSVSGRPLTAAENYVAQKNQIRKDNERTVTGTAVRIA